MKLQKGRVISISVLIVIYFYIVFCVWGIATDSPNLINIFYSQSYKTSLPINLSYPPPINGQLQDKALQVSFELQANNTIAEGVNLTLSKINGVVFLKNSLGKSIQYAIIGFSNTKPGTPFTATYGWFDDFEYYNYECLDGAWLDVQDIWDSEDFRSLIRVRELEEFNFPVAGDYSPSIIIALENKTILFHTYDSIKVHVASHTELQSQRLDRINGLVTLALFAFTFFEIYQIIIALTKRKSNKTKSKKSDEHKISKRRLFHLKTKRSKIKRSPNKSE